MPSNIFQSVLGAAQAIPGFGNNKPHAQVHYSEQGMPLCNPPPQYGHLQQCDPHITPKHQVLLERFRKLRRWTKIAVALSSTISALLSVFMESIMIYATYKFYKTKDLYVEGRPWGPWARNTELWPSYMLAGASLVTLLLAFALLIALCCRAKRKATFFSLLGALAHIIFWIVISVLYRVGKTEKDLWGWSCTDKAKAIQDQLGSDVLDFESLCTLQVRSSSPCQLLPTRRMKCGFFDNALSQGSSWEVSIGEVGLKILTTGVGWFFNRKQNGLKSDLLVDLGSAAFDQYGG